MQRRQGKEKARVWRFQEAHGSAWHSQPTRRIPGGEPHLGGDMGNMRSLLHGESVGLQCLTAVDARHALPQGLRLSPYPHTYTFTDVENNVRSGRRTLLAGTTPFKKSLPGLDTRQELGDAHIVPHRQRCICSDPNTQMPKPQDKNLEVKSKAQRIIGQNIPKLQLP